MTNKIRIGRLSLNLPGEVISKVTREVLDLFGIVIDEDSFDFAGIELFHDVVHGNPMRVATEMTLIKANGESKRFHAEGEARSDEIERAAINRLVKLNFYQLLRETFSFASAPWGILHGVRPSKIVQRYIDRGMERDAIISRLRDDYDVSREKAELLTDISFHERPFIAMTDPRTISVYVGIPFCLTRCLYCSFPSVILPSNDVLDEFMRVFERDLRAATSDVRANHFKVQNIYIGGGTPTSLPDGYFGRMMELVCGAFYNDGIVEFTVEAGRPDSVTPAKLSAMAGHHVNRVSVNPQTMRDATLRRIGRNHTAEDIVRMYHEVREAGLPSINMDVILGLPGEDEHDVAYTMGEIERLAPDDVTLHALALKRGSDLKTNLILKTMENDLPDDATVRRMYEAAMEKIRAMRLTPYYLYRQGYQSGQLENIGCCKVGRESMYNMQIMEEKQTIIGVGGAATSKIVNPKTQRMEASFNPKDLKTYLEKIDYYIEKRRNLIDMAYD